MDFLTGLAVFARWNTQMLVRERKQRNASLMVHPYVNALSLINIYINNIKEDIHCVTRAGRMFRKRTFTIESCAFCFLFEDTSDYNFSL